jgi:hypothetical protein
MSDETETRPRGVEPPELHPGGADSIEDPEKYGATPGPPTTRDLQPEDNPAVDDVLPDEVAEPDDKSQEPDTGTSGDEETHDEPSA